MTTRYASKFGAGLANTRKAVAELRPFDAGSLYGAGPTDFSRWSFGILPEGWRTDFVNGVESYTIDYVVFSYQTPIAWHDWARDEWVVPNVRYSNTTTGHQSVVNSALRGYWAKEDVPLDQIRTVTLAALSRAAEIFA